MQQAPGESQVRSETDDGQHRREAPGGMPTYQKVLPVDIVGAFCANEMHRMGEYIPPVVLLFRSAIHAVRRFSMAPAVCGVFQVRLEFICATGEDNCDSIRQTFQTFDQ